MPPRKGTRKGAGKTTASAKPAEEGKGNARNTAKPALRSTKSAPRSKAEPSKRDTIKARTQEPIDNSDEHTDNSNTAEPHEGHSRASVAERPPFLPTAATPRHNTATPYGLRFGNFTPSAQGTGRTVLSPVAGRKYTRVNIDLSFTPRRNRNMGDGYNKSGTPLDPMRIAVSRTPYTAKRTIAEYESEKDPIKTYLRLKPANLELLKGGKPPKSSLQVVSDKEVEVAKGMAENSLCERYLFAGVMPSLTKQPRVFQVCAVPVINDLFSGYNTLLFTYGVTNSGKTHTIQGSTDNPGLLPRSISAILSILDRHNVQGDFPIKPKYSTQVEYCSDSRIVSPKFRIASNEESWVSSLETIQESDFSEMLSEITPELGNELSANKESEWVYQLYVSYFEIYNEMVHDLLDLTTLTTTNTINSSNEPSSFSTHTGNGRSREKAGRGRGRGRARRGTAASGAAEVAAAETLTMNPSQIAQLPRVALSLRAEGGRGNEAFVDGVTEVRIQSVRDLVRVLIHGQTRRSVHATGLNSGSSRSHALFQAKLVKIRRDANIVPLGSVPASACASVRTMTIVDLAGSERAKRTHNQGDRLAEAGKINVSLMTLKKCLDVKRYNATLTTSTGINGSQDMHSNDIGAQLVPYNESKLTKLFQPALEGGAKTVMVVCVDPYEYNDSSDNTNNSRSSLSLQPAHTFTETRNVLEFARVASSLVTRVRKVEDPKHINTSSDLHSDANSDDNMYNEEDDEDDEDEIFFDTQTRRKPAAMSKKRLVDHAGVDIGIQTEDDVFSYYVVSPTKRQRMDSDGKWVSPALMQINKAASISELKNKTPSIESRLSVHSKEWEAMTRGSSFDFIPPNEKKVNLSGSSTQNHTLKSNDTDNESIIAKLKTELAEQKRRADEIEREKESEISELVNYSENLREIIDDLRHKYVAIQEQCIKIEMQTREEVSAFFVEKISEVKELERLRLHEELTFSEAKSAHKLDILSRLHTVPRPLTPPGDNDDEVSDNGDPSRVPTISPRSGARLAARRAASKRSARSARTNAEKNVQLSHLRGLVEALEGQISSQQAQINMMQQTSATERATREKLESALAESKNRVSSLEESLVTLSSEHPNEDAELQMMRAHEQERAKFLSQITALKARLRDAEAHAIRSRRDWETHELMPLQERLRVMLNAKHKDGEEKGASSSELELSENLKRAVRDRDDAWQWWTKEQERNSQLRTQNDILMREIRNLRAGLPASSQISEGSVGGGSALMETDRQEVEFATDSDDSSFCKISLSSLNSISAMNSENPNLGYSSLGLGQSAENGHKRGLSRITSKGRAFHRSQNQLKNAFKGNGDGGDGEQSKHNRIESRAKRVVSRVFNHFSPDSKRKGGLKPQASIDKQLLNKQQQQDQQQQQHQQQHQRQQSENSTPSIERYTPEIHSTDNDSFPYHGQSVVFSDSTGTQKTGRTSVAFAFDHTHELALSHEAIPEAAESEEAAFEHPEDKEDISMSIGTDAPASRKRIPSPQGTKRTRAMMRKMAVRAAQEESKSRSNTEVSLTSHNATDSSDINNSTSRPLQPTEPLYIDLNHGMSSEMLKSPTPTVQSTGKKKRKLHAGRTVLNVTTPDSDEDIDDLVGAPLVSPTMMQSHRMSTSIPPRSSSMSVSSAHIRNITSPSLSKPAQPQESKQPVLFTPIRTRAKSRIREEANDMQVHGHDMGSPARGDRGGYDGILLTPMKMLNRLRKKK